MINLPYRFYILHMKMDENFKEIYDRAKHDKT